MGLNFDLFSFLPSSLPPEFSGIDTYTSRLQLYKNSKGFGQGKVLRKSSRTIKLSDVQPVVLSLASQLTSEPREIFVVGRFFDMLL